MEIKNSLKIVILNNINQIMEHYNMIAVIKVLEVVE